MKHLWKEWGELLARYRDVVRAAWCQRKQNDPVHRTTDELEFLSAHLELMETPVSPLSMCWLRITASLVVLAVLWSWLGSLDVVTVAQGRIVPGGRSKVIQPAQSAVVSAILVRDGQHVRTGDVVLTLDAASSAAEYEKAQQSWESARLDVARLEALLQALVSGQLPRTSPLEGIAGSRQHAGQRLAGGQWQAYLARRAALMAVIDQHNAEIATLRQQISKLESARHIAREREQNYRELLAKQFISRHAYLEKQQQSSELNSEIAVQNSRINEVQAMVARQQRDLTLAGAEFRKELLDQLRQARERMNQWQEDTRKTEALHQRHRVVAPVDGTVQQLAVHTVGGVVTEAQTLMVIVPDGDALEVDAWIDNPDVGFVREGQRVVIKIDSFPYTRYGTLEATVQSISRDAVQDEKRGWGFPARLRLAGTSLLVDGKPVSVQPGMTVSAEIHTGQRRIISYFLGPLLEYSGESFRER